ncbi:MAG: hypothetical protein D6772_16195 [Bacteroidetes bacterium]|nr:MAG: hypothetical protein D6772_16195 [Bacteroidota bacterium]
MRQLSPTRTWRWQAKPVAPRPGFEGLYWSDFNSGREAIYALLTQGEIPKGKLALLPAWVPEGIYQPFHLAGCTIHFYELNCFGQIDQARLQAQLAQLPVELSYFVQIHYFGLKRPATWLRELLPQAVCWIEDWAHSWPEANREYHAGHWHIFSPTKLVGVPEGGWLLGAQAVVVAPRSVMWRWFYLWWRLCYLGIASLTFRRAACARLGAPFVNFAYTRSYRTLLKLTQQPQPLSRLGQYLLEHYPMDLLLRRQRQAQRYHEELNNTYLKKGYVDWPDCIPVLLAYPLLVENRSHFLDYLAAHQIGPQLFTDRWWFVAQEQNALYPGARQLLDQHVLLPLNQDFRKEELDYIIRVVNAYRPPS